MQNWFGLYCQTGLEFDNILLCPVVIFEEDLEVKKEIEWPCVWVLLSQGMSGNLFATIIKGHSALFTGSSRIMQSI